jgi:hypothetical protein
LEGVAQRLRHALLIASVLSFVQFTPAGPKVLDRGRLIQPDTQCGYGPRRFADALVNWVQPAYANRHVIIRNDTEIRRVSLEAE